MTPKNLPLHDIHIKLGAKMVSFAGFNMPVRYSSNIEEHIAVRNAVGVFDVSHMGEFYLSGPNALELLQTLISNDASQLVSGQAQYAVFPNATGGIIDDLIVYKISDSNYLLVVNASNIKKDWNWILKHNDRNVTVENNSEQMCLFAVQGPKAMNLLQKLTSLDLEKIRYYHFVIYEFAGVKDVIISNTGYTGSGGFEIFCERKYGEKIWNSIFEAGKSEGVKPIGLSARDTLRLEMGYCLYGNDIDDNTSPIEAGLGWIVKFTKEFINSKYLKEQKEEGVKRKLVSFIMSDKGIPRHGYDICDSRGNGIGRVTSGSQSPVLKVGIGLGYVPIEYSKMGTKIFVEIRGKLLEATVRKSPLITTGTK